MTVRSILLAALFGLALCACGARDERASDERASEEHPSDEDAPDTHAHAGDAPADAQPQDEGDEHAETPASTVIPAAIAQASGIRVADARRGTIADEHEVQGLLTPIEGASAQAMARFPGPVRALRASVGDTVRAGQPLAVIESNLSLTTYTVPAPISGTVLQRSASVGAVAGEGMALFEIADLSRLWVDLHIFGADAGHIAPGAPVTVTRISDGVTASTALDRILPGTATASQSTVARATVANDDGLWRPGAAVRARIVVDRSDAAVSVPLSALQTDEAGRDVVYVRRGQRYEERGVVPGRRDASRVEIVSGLRAGEPVVVAQSFLVKADIGKSAAAHEH